MKVELIHKFENKLRQKGVFDNIKHYFHPSIPTSTFSLNKFFSKPRPIAMAPISINLDLTLSCNYQCPHCIDSSVIKQHPKFTFAEISKTLINLHQGGLRSVILIGGGEPTIYPKFKEVVRLIKSLGLQCAIVSNGSMNRKIAEVAHLLNKGDWVRLSLDAGTDEVFHRLHRPHTAISLDAICREASEIKRANSSIQMGYSFVVITPDVVKFNSALVPNYHEIEKAAILAKANLFDYISLKPFLIRNAEGKETLPVGMRDRSHKNKISNILKRETKLSRKHTSGTFQVIESINFISILKDNPEQAMCQPTKCFMQALRQVVSPLGIYTCPAFRGNRKSLIAQKDGYATINKYLHTTKKASDQIGKFDASYECRDISCIYNSTNWWLNSLADNPHGRDIHLPVFNKYDMFL